MREISLCDFVETKRGMEEPIVPMIHTWESPIIIISEKCLGGSRLH